MRSNAFGIALHQVGWRVTYLGAATPAGMIAEAAEAVKPRLTVVAAVMPGRLDRDAHELTALARHWALAVGGGGRDGPCSPAIAPIRS